MNQSLRNTPAVDDGGIDFEFTDVAVVRAELDSASAKAPKTHPPGHWEALRRKPLPTDRALSGTTLDWLIALPAALRPRALCERYPRVVNAIADAWPDPAARVATLDALLADQRGGRRGFPPNLRNEIEALRRAAGQSPRV